LYNPIVGIYELKKMFGLKDLPESDRRTARILRRFTPGKREILVNADEYEIKLWLGFWCIYTDCVFVDLNTHSIRHEFELKSEIGLQAWSYNSKVIVDYKLHINDPIQIVREQITNTDVYMRGLLEVELHRIVKDGIVMTSDELEVQLYDKIISSELINSVFSLKDLSIRVTKAKDENSNFRFKNQSIAQLSDVKKLLEIAKNSNLEEFEEEEVTRIILNGPD